MPVIPFKFNDKSIAPQLGAFTWLAPDAWVIGDCIVGDNTSLLFGAVVRGDVMPVRIGSRCNIQDGVIIHSSTGLHPAVIEDGVTVGHRAIIHGCTVRENCIIGMAATILDGAQIGAGSIVGANALITKNTIIPERSLVLGSPAKVVRSITDAEFTEILISAQHYVEKGLEYQALMPHS